MGSAWEVKNMMEDIKDVDHRLKALEHADWLEQMYVNGAADDTLKGTLGGLRVKTFLAKWLADHPEEAAVQKPAAAVRKRRVKKQNIPERDNIPTRPILG